MAIDYRGVFVVVEIWGIEGIQKMFLSSEQNFAIHYGRGVRGLVRKYLQIPERYEKQILLYYGGRSLEDVPTVLVAVKLVIPPQSRVDGELALLFQEVMQSLCEGVHDFTCGFVTCPVRCIVDYRNPDAMEPSPEAFQS